MQSERLADFSARTCVGLLLSQPVIFLQVWLVGHDPHFVQRLLSVVFGEFVYHIFFKFLFSLSPMVSKATYDVKPVFLSHWPGAPSQRTQSGRLKSGEETLPAAIEFPINNTNNFFVRRIH